MLGSSNTGYIDKDLIEMWFEHIFIPNCGVRRPVLLDLDNHETHITINITKKARDNDIHIFGLPPHKTHILRPLDIGIFGHLKGKGKDIGNFTYSHV